METFNDKKRKNHHLIAGILLLTIGSLFMLKSVGIMIPFWILTWHTVLLTIGLLIGYKKNFRAGGWVVMVLIGSIFTLKDILIFDISNFTTPLILIGLGIYIMFKPRNEHRFCNFDHKKESV